MRSNPERLAWTVTLTAFGIFCLLAISIPLGARWYLTSATNTYQVKVTCLEGTAVVEHPQRTTAIPLLKGETMSVPEGSVISVDDAAQALLTFYDQSLVRLFPSTSVAIPAMRSPRFSFSKKHAEIAVHARGGRLWVDTALASSRPLDFTIDTLQSEIDLAEDGGYTVEVNNTSTEVIVQRGTATVRSTAAGIPASTAEVTLGARQRTVVEIGSSPLAPLKAERDLITNGDFGQPLSSGWSARNEQGGDGGTVDGTVTQIVDEGRRAVRFYRTGGEYNHCETIIEQEINRDLPDPMTTLKVRANIKVVSQSLSGGGYLSSEYPLMIRITYRDIYQSETQWTHGFYYQNTANNPTMNGQEVPQGEWYYYESENLLDTLPITPHRIVSIRVYAAGWSYESLVSGIGLVVE